MRVARTNHERMQQLLSAGAATQQTYDDAEARDQSTSAGHGLALAHVRGATARIDEARAALEGAQASLGYTRIVAPFSGRVIDRRVDPGTQAAPGIPLLVIEQAGALRVEAAIDESQAGNLEVGQTAHVTLEALGHDVQGRITEVVPTVDPTSRAFTIKVELPPALEAKLRPGMFARVRFPVGVDDRLMVPAAAISLLGDLERLFVVQNGRADLRLVTLGQRQGDRVEVLSGLDPGEFVVSSPPADLRDGARVEGRR
jgi:RND family efflux transporter MFP subunit